MPSATVTSLSEDEVDDLLYFARVGDLQELLSSLEAFAKSANTTQASIVSAAVDEQSGNGILHMASANGHIDTLKHLITLCASASPISTMTLLNSQNASGNTPLHWASLNGHLEAVKLFIDAGADPTMTNEAGHDAVYEAEINGKDAVVEWLLTEGKGLETSAMGDHQGASVEDAMREQIEATAVDEDLEHISLEEAP